MQNLQKVEDGYDVVNFEFSNRSWFQKVVWIGK